MNYFINVVENTIIETKPTRTVTFNVPQGIDTMNYFHTIVLGPDGLNGWYRDVKILHVQETTPWWVSLIRRWYDFQEFTVLYSITFEHNRGGQKK